MGNKVGGRNVLSVSHMNGFTFIFTFPQLIRTYNLQGVGHTVDMLGGYVEFCSRN